MEILKQGSQRIYLVRWFSYSCYYKVLEQVSKQLRVVTALQIQHLKTAVLFGHSVNLKTQSLIFLTTVKTNLQILVK